MSYLNKARIAIFLAMFVGLLLGWNRFDLPMAELILAFCPDLWEFTPGFLASLTTIGLGLIAGGCMYLNELERGPEKSMLKERLFWIILVTAFCIVETVFQIIGENFNRYGFRSRVFIDSDFVCSTWAMPLVLTALQACAKRCDSKSNETPDNSGPVAELKKQTWHCPECLCEYREGFFECADCKIPLVMG